MLKKKGVNMAEKHAGGRPPLFKTKEELQEKLDAYKQYLLETGKPPTIAGLAYYTGIDRQTIYNYSEKDEFFGIIKEFRNFVMMNYEELAIDKGNGGIVFLLKNYGYTDRQELEHSGEIVMPTIKIEK
jgi:hypothetical protein